MTAATFKPRGLCTVLHLVYSNVRVILPVSSGGKVRGFLRSRLVVRMKMALEQSTPRVCSASVALVLASFQLPVSQASRKPT